MRQSKQCVWVVTLSKASEVIPSSSHSDHLLSLGYLRGGQEGWWWELLRRSLNLHVSSRAHFESLPSKSTGSFVLCNFGMYWQMEEESDLRVDPVRRGLLVCYCSMKVSSVIRLKVKEDWTESFTESLSTRVFWIESISTGSDSCCVTISRWRKRVTIRLGVDDQCVSSTLLSKSSGIKLRVQMEPRSQKLYTCLWLGAHLKSTAPSISTGSFALCDFVCIGTWNWRVAIR